MIMQHKCHIKTWKQFDKKVRPEMSNLLKNLDNFSNSVLVTGCQRSGTTILSRIITQSDGMVNFWFGKDDELDGALILSGLVNYTKPGRHCFQTTYLNECYHEYFNYSNGHKIIWVLRNPLSVVYSLLYNWERRPLNGLFDGCGVHLLNDKQKIRYEKYGHWVINRLSKACLSYNGKTQQLFEIKERLGDRKVMVVEYEDLVLKGEKVLSAIYDFLELQYKPSYTDKISLKSLSKADRLSFAKKAFIEKNCMPIYEKAKTLVSYSNNN